MAQDPWRTVWVLSLTLTVCGLSLAFADALNYEGQFPIAPHVPRHVRLYAGFVGAIAGLSAWLAHARMGDRRVG